MTKTLEGALLDTAMPLINIDRAELYLVAESASDIHLHLGGAYSGCPGVHFVKTHLLAPIVAEVSPKATLKVTSGLPIPKGARKLG